jgi:hypothetical protein
VAVNAALDGDTVLIPAGSCTWAAPVKWTNKNINVIGAGMDSTNTPPTTGTIITLLGSGIYISHTTKNSFRISEMTFTGTPPGSTSAIFPDAQGVSGAVSGWRIDHVRFHYATEVAATSIFVQGINYGLIDNCLFTGYGNPGVNAAFQNGYDSSLYGQHSADLALDLGGSSALYIEDCTWNFTGSGNLSAVNDLQTGGRMVFRHNTVTNGWFQTHATRGTDRGGLKYEIYNNTWTGIGNQNPISLLSGTGVVFNNTISGYGFDQVWMYNQRSSTVFTLPLGRCDGTSDASLIYDRIIEVNGWPCLDQVGWYGGTPKSQTNYPVYFWNNGTSAGCATGGTCNNSTVLKVTADKDWIMPNVDHATHTGGIVDYVNNGTTAKPGYTPYTYPHPLRTNTWDANLRIAK